MESIVTQQINQIRDTEQRKALNAWAKQGFVGSVIAGTGFGKSRVGILAIDYILKQKGKKVFLRWFYTFSRLEIPTTQLDITKEG